MAADGHFTRHPHKMDSNTSGQELALIAESASSLQAHEDATEVAGEAFQQIVSVGKS